MAADESARHFYGLYMLMHAALVWRFRSGVADDQRPGTAPDGAGGRWHRLGRWHAGAGCSAGSHASAGRLRADAWRRLGRRLSPAWSGCLFLRVLAAVFCGRPAGGVCLEPLRRSGCQRCFGARRDRCPRQGSTAGCWLLVKSRGWSAVAGPTRLPRRRSGNRSGSAAGTRWPQGCWKSLTTTVPRVTLEGPAVYKVDVPNGGFLSFGKLTAQIGKTGSRPEAGEGHRPPPRRMRHDDPAEFRVVTSTAALVDRFGQGARVGRGGRQIGRDLPARLRKARSHVVLRFRPEKAYPLEKDAWVATRAGANHDSAFFTKVGRATPNYAIEPPKTPLVTSVDGAARSGGDREKRPGPENWLLEWEDKGANHDRGT